MEVLNRFSLKWIAAMTITSRLLLNRESRFSSPQKTGQVICYQRPSSPETLPRIRNSLGCLPHQNVTFACCELFCMSDVRTWDRDEHAGVESEANRLQLASECGTWTRDVAPDGVRPRLRSLFPMTSDLVQQRWTSDARGIALSSHS